MEKSNVTSVKCLTRAQKLASITLARSVKNTRIFITKNEPKKKKSYSEMLRREIILIMYCNKLDD